jgi:hypothetical protein
MKKLYRFNTNNSHSFTSTIKYEYGNTVVCLDIFDVVKETICGSWIDLIGKKKFVNHTCVKQFAYRTEEEALLNFIHRKDKQILILNSQIKQAENSLFAINLKKDLDFLRFGFRDSYKKNSLIDSPIEFGFDKTLPDH